MKKYIIANYNYYYGNQYKTKLQLYVLARAIKSVNKWQSASPAIIIYDKIITSNLFLFTDYYDLNIVFESNDEKEVIDKYLTLATFE